MSSDLPHPQWLLQLVDQMHTGRVLPGGMLWEEPPPKMVGSRVGANGTEQGRMWKSGAQQATRVRPEPLTPIRVRAQIFEVLRATPGRWARVYDGQWTAAMTMAVWYRKRSAGFCVDAVARRVGMTVAVYARHRKAQRKEGISGVQ